MGWTGWKHLIPRKTGRKESAKSAMSSENTSSGVEAAIDTAVDVVGDDVTSPSYLAANMSSLCDEKRLLEESSMNLVKSSRRKSRRQSQKSASNGSSAAVDAPSDEDSTDEEDDDDDDDDDWQDDVILDPAAVPTNNHMMVNSERDAHGRLQHLTRSRYLDMLARGHAAVMVDGTTLEHSVDELADLQKKLNSANVGENILRGNNLDDMHQMSMTSKTLNRMNILHPSYNEFGMGTAQGKDGKLYMTQLFRQVDSTWHNSFVAVPQKVKSGAGTVETAAPQPQTIEEEEEDQQQQQQEPQHPQEQQPQHARQMDESDEIMDTACCVHLCIQ